MTTAPMRPAPHESVYASTGLIRLVDTSLGLVRDICAIQHGIDSFRSTEIPLPIHEFDSYCLGRKWMGEIPPSRLNLNVWAKTGPPRISAAALGRSLFGERISRASLAYHISTRAGKDAWMCHLGELNYITEEFSLGRMDGIRTFPDGQTE